MSYLRKTITVASKDGNTILPVSEIKSINTKRKIATISYKDGSVGTFEMESLQSTSELGHKFRLAVEELVESETTQSNVLSLEKTNDILLDIFKNQSADGSLVSIGKWFARFFTVTLTFVSIIALILVGVSFGWIFSCLFIPVIAYSVRLYIANEA